MEHENSPRGEQLRLGWQVLAVGGWVVVDRLKGEEIQGEIGLTCFTWSIPLGE